MFLNLRELELHEVRFDEDFPAGEIEFDSNQLRQISPLQAEGVAELLNATLGEIRIRGHIKVDLELPCDRCLEPVEYAIDRDFDLYYGPATERVETPHEVEIHKGDTDIGFYEGIGMELSEVLREYILLSIPMRLICRADCAGICPKCGQNRNTGSCGCVEEKVNDRWSALRDWKHDGVKASKD